MAANRSSFELFRLTGGVTGTPDRLEPASFSALGALELQHIERWIRERPLLLGEDLKVVTHQFSAFEGARDRLDVLALDHDGRLVVIEVKRDTSGAYQDLQALRYAAFVSTFRAEQLAEAHAAYLRAQGREIDAEDARRELEEFIEGGDLDVVDEDVQPRIVLVAAGFQPAVMSTVLWLCRAYRADITCVQLVPYQIGGELLLGSSILIPLPEAGDYEVKVAEKLHAATSKKATVAPLDHEKATAFIASVPKGRWTAYVDVATAGDSPNGFRGVGSWRSSTTEDVPNVYRVLNRRGEVSEGWKGTDPLPHNAEGVRALLTREGVSFGDDGRADQDQRWTVEDWGPAVGTAEPDDDETEH
jgi:alkylated DNA nucleotide flippase Atl1